MKQFQRVVLEASLAAADKGQAILKTYFGRVRNVSRKRGAGLVSEADKKSEEVILKSLKRSLPLSVAVAEESQQNFKHLQNDQVWIVDPLDGTHNFVYGFPYFCISIGFQLNGVLEVGVVDLPLLNYRFHAVRGCGAFLNGRRIHVAKDRNLKDSLLATGFAYQSKSVFEEQLNLFSKIHQNCLGVRRPGAAAADLCFVANGSFSGFWEKGLKPWDMAAGALMIREAGGVVTNYGSRELDLKNDTIVAAHKHLHSQLNRLVRK